MDREAWWTAVQGYSPWDPKESDTPERLSTAHSLVNHFVFLHSVSSVTQSCPALCDHIDSSVRVQLQQPGNQPEGMDSVGE